MFLALVVLICSSSLALGRSPIPFRCPAVPIKDPDFCARALVFSNCKTDSDCKGGEKCCPGICGSKQCKGGSSSMCPLPVGRQCPVTRDQCQDNNDCRNGEVCCLEPSCGKECKKPPTCPPAPPVKKECSYRFIKPGCKEDAHCKAGTLCCASDCGVKQCVVVGPRPDCPRIDPNIRCILFARDCLADVDCERGAKCCLHRSCGYSCEGGSNTNPKDKRCPSYRRDISCKRFDFKCSSKKICRKGSICCPESCGSRCVALKPKTRPGRTPRCFLPKRVGPCDGAYRRYFYCAKVKGCVRFIYGGCGGNKNNFKTKRECEQTCTYPPVNPCPVPGCIAPPKGSCKKRKIVIINGRRCPLCLEQVPCPECSLPKKVGPCKARIPRYFFNKNTGLCGIFFWGGCQPNKNNFKTFEDCQRRCGGKRPDCSLPKKVGPCEALIPRYFYNKKTLRCEKFIYGGCEGNENNFESLADCQAQCKKDKPVCGPVCAIFCPFGNVLDDKGCPTCRCKTVNPCPVPGCIAPPKGSCTKRKIVVINGRRCPLCLEQIPCPECSLPKKVGPCKARVLRYYYNKNTGLCGKFYWGGCQPNKNNFKTFEDCQRRCGGKRPDCSLPKKVGRCKALIPRYFYNKKTLRCEKFIYGGCEGNENNFESLADCQAQCKKDKPVCGPVCAIFCPFGNVLDDKGCPTCRCKTVNPCPVPGCIAPPKGSCTKRKIVVINGRRCPLCLEQIPCPECSLPKKVGPCKARVLRYYYNKNTGLCGKFYWGGCQPNKNNFKTFEDCQRRCGGKRPDCSLPKKVGRCKALIPRYFYNKKTLRCEKFIYGGCEGNENNFESLADCQAQCKKDKPVCGPVCAIFCPFGNVLDDKGCPTCRCKTGCKGNAKPVGGGCAPGKRRCPGGSKCKMIPGGTSGVCCRQCPLLRCKECELGNVIDENGCRTCQCNPDPCKHGSASPVRFCTQGQSDCPKSQKCVQITNKGDKSVCCPKAPCLAPPCPRPHPDWCTEPTYYYNEDGVRCRGCYRRIPCDKPCPQIKCQKFCEFGSFPLDGYPDCPSCDCKQACEDGAKPLSGVSCGSGSQRCPGNYKCSKSVSLLTKKRVCCPISMCVHRLLSANREGHYYCRNKEPKCGPVCLIFCEFGNVLDDRGCPTCECKPGCENGATPGKPCRSDSECFAKPGSTATCVKNGSSRTHGICCSKGGNNVCPKGKSKGRCSLSIPPTNCGQGQFCRNNVCCDIPCPNGPPLVGKTCSQFTGGPQCPPGSSCLVGPADEYFACCPDSNGNFVCPKPIGAGICVEQCSTDSDCSPGKKCCSNGCGHVCTKACRIPMCVVPCLFGSNLDKNGCETCDCKTGCKNNAPVTGVCEVDATRCPPGDKCVRPPGVPRKHGVCCSEVDKPGKCPKATGFGICVERCSGDGSCPRDQKCCSNGCGHVCTDPVKPNPVICRDGSKPLPDIFCGRGPGRKDCPEGSSCYIDPTDRFAVCCKIRACTKIGCRFPCEHGSFPDKNGCPTCNCKPAPKKRYT